MSKILPTGCSVFLTTTQLNQGQNWNPKSIDALCPVFSQSVGNMAKKQPQKLLSLAQKWPVNRSGMEWTPIGGLKAKGTYIRLEVWELWEKKKSLDRNHQQIKMCKSEGWMRSHVRAPGRPVLLQTPFYLPCYLARSHDSHMPHESLENTHKVYFRDNFQSARLTIPPPHKETQP